MRSQLGLKGWYSKDEQTSHLPVHNGTQISCINVEIAGQETAKLGQKLKIEWWLQRHQTVGTRLKLQYGRRWIHYLRTAPCWKAVSLLWLFRASRRGFWAPSGMCKERVYKHCRKGIKAEFPPCRLFANDSDSSGIVMTKSSWLVDLKVAQLSYKLFFCFPTSFDETSRDCSVFLSFQMYNWFLMWGN